MRLNGLIGIIILLGIAYALSNNRKAINARTVIWGIGLQIFFALIILKIPFVKAQFSFIDELFKKLISFSDAGSNFLFQSVFNVAPDSWNKIEKNHKRVIMEHIDIKNDSILDIGCAYGRPYINEMKNYVGIDLSPEFI